MSASMTPPHAAMTTPRVVRNAVKGVRKESAKNTTTIVPTVMIVPSIAVATGRDTGTPVASSDRPEE